MKDSEKLRKEKEMKDNEKLRKENEDIKKKLEQMEAGKNKPELVAAQKPDIPIYQQFDKHRLGQAGDTDGKKGWFSMEYARFFGG